MLEGFERATATCAGSRPSRGAGLGLQRRRGGGAGRGDDRPRRRHAGRPRVRRAPPLPPPGGLATLRARRRPGRAGGGRARTPPATSRTGSTATSRASPTPRTSPCPAPSSPATPRCGPRRCARSAASTNRSGSTATRTSSWRCGCARAGVELGYDPEALAWQAYDKDLGGLQRDTLAKGQDHRPARPQPPRGLPRSAPRQPRRRLASLAGGAGGAAGADAAAAGGPPPSVFALLLAARAARRLAVAALLPAGPRLRLLGRGGRRAARIKRRGRAVEACRRARAWPDRSSSTPIAAFSAAPRTRCSCCSRSLDRGEWEPTLLLEDAPEVAAAGRARRGARGAGAADPADAAGAGRRAAGAGAGATAAARAPRRLPRPHELARRLQVGPGGGGGWPACRRCWGRSRSAPTSRRTAPPTGSCGRSRGGSTATSRSPARSPTSWSSGSAGRRRRSRSLYNAVDVERTAVPAPPGLREQLGGSETRPLVLTPARLNAQKGHDTLLRGDQPRCRRHSSSSPATGPNAGALEALAAELGVDRAGPLPRPPRGRAAAARRLRRLRPALPLRGVLAGGAGGDGGRDPGRLLGDRRHRRADRRRAQRAAGAARRCAGAGRRRCGALLADPRLRHDFAARARERVDAGLTREQNADSGRRGLPRVCWTHPRRRGRAFPSIARESSAAASRTLPESRRNPLLRRRDWRFLLPDAELSGPLAAAATRWHARRARRRAEAAGYTDVRAYWTGPLPHRLPQFWLPLDRPRRQRTTCSRPGSAVGRGLDPALLWRAAAQRRVCWPRSTSSAGGRAGRTTEGIPLASS